MSHRNNKPEELERSLGFWSILAIGVGTMVGAGVFVFPGLAGGYAGMGAVFSFLLAGSIAMLVALCTAELATAMPENGGGYYFVSRTVGPRVGMIIGIGQWFGLVFACAFYLTGFAEYFVKIMEEIGWPISDPIILIALGAALLLLVVNLIGTQKVGKLQNYIVLVLLLLLATLFTYGLMTRTGQIKSLNWSASFAPNGSMSIISTTTLIFTSFLGFVQIATVAGEVSQPHKNLPRALVWSVIIATVIYILAVFVSTLIFTSNQLAEMGETAMVEVARALASDWGALALLTAGLLATLSSANASILSSSRAVYALGHDQMLPKFISQVNKKFGTPHFALLAVGIPILSIIFIGRIEVLAEVASFLHLLLYGMICVALIICRRNRPLWYTPSFRIPLYPLIPYAGGILCLGLVMMMKPVSIAIGCGIIFGAIAWYYWYASEVRIPPYEPSHIVQAIKNPSFLMPLKLTDTVMPPAVIMDVFNNLKLFILGYKITKDQTSPQQAKNNEVGEENNILKNIAEKIKGKGHEVETQLIFTPDLEKSLERYVKKKDYQAVLLLRKTKLLKRLILLIQVPEQLTYRLMTIVREIQTESRLPINVFLINNKGKEMAARENLHLKIKKYLSDMGMPDEKLFVKNFESAGFIKDIKKELEPEDFVILGTDPKLKQDSLFANLFHKKWRGIKSSFLIVLNKNNI